MSVEQMREVWLRDVEGATQQVLLVLANAANDDGENVYPSQAFVAWKAGLELPTVKAVFHKLRHDKVLILVRRGSRRPGERQSNEYRLDLSRLPVKPNLIEWMKKRGMEPSSWMLAHEARKAKSGIPDIPDSNDSGISEGDSGISSSGSSGIPDIPKRKRGKKELESEGEATGARAPRRGGGSPLPPDFSLTPEMREWARLNVPTLRPAQIERETMLFITNARSKQTLSHDWLAAWQFWVLRKAGWVETDAASKPTNQHALPLAAAQQKRYDPHCPKCQGSGQEFAPGKGIVGRCDCHEKGGEQP